MDPYSEEKYQQKKIPLCLWWCHVEKNLFVILTLTRHFLLQYISFFLQRTTSCRKDSTASEKSLVTRVATKRASIASITNTGGSGAEDSRQDIHELNAKNTCLSSSSGTTTTAAAGAGEISGGAKRSRGRISSTSSSSDFIPYGGLEQEQALQYYAEQGWCLDEFGEWFHDPASASAFLEKRRKSSTASSTNTASTTAAATSATSKAAANLPGSTGGSSTVVGKNTKPAQNQKSDKNQNAHMPSSTPAMSQTIMPDNYEEGWYQDEYGNWLNQFDWKQVLIKKCNQILKCIDSGGKKYALY